MAPEAARILLVENLEAMGQVIGLYLLSAGFEIAKVKTPEEASERLASQEPDLIIFNTGLPPEQKSAFISHWRSLAPATKILEISENPLILKSSIPLHQIGAADRYLPIPFDFEKLADEVSECLRE